MQCLNKFSVFDFLCFRCSIVNCGKEFKLKTHLARHYAQAHGIAISSGSPRPIMKTRTAFYLHTNPMTRLARLMCRNFVKPKKAARQSSYAINSQLVKQECKFLLKDFLLNLILWLRSRITRVSVSVFVENTRTAAMKYNHCGNDSRPPIGIFLY